MLETCDILTSTTVRWSFNVSTRRRAHQLSAGAQHAARRAAVLGHQARVPGAPRHLSAQPAAQLQLQGATHISTIHARSSAWAYKVYVILIVWKTLLYQLTGHVMCKCLVHCVLLCFCRVLSLTPLSHTIAEYAVHSSTVQTGWDPLIG